MYLLGKSSLYVSTTLFIVSVALFCLLYRDLSFGLPHHQLEKPILPDLAIELHPKHHIYRNARTIYHCWNITKGYGSPDGVKTLVYKINGSHILSASNCKGPIANHADYDSGRFPGPTIETRSGDTLVIEVHNWLQDDEGLAFHWHGLNMRGSTNRTSALTSTD